MKRLIWKLVYGLARPYVQNHDGLIFTPWGAVLADTQAEQVEPFPSKWEEYQPKRLPKAPDGYRFIPFRDQATGWPGYLLQKCEQDS